MVVCEREKVETSAHELPDTVWVASEIERRLLFLGVAVKIVAVGYNGLNVGEVDIPVYLLGDAGQRFGKGLQSAVLVNA